MKKLSVLICILVVISSCSSPSIMVSLEGINQKGMEKKNNTYFYNDTIDVKYSFWSGNGGIICFCLTNKTDKPIYINWFRSKYFIGQSSFNYWEDVINSETSSSSFGKINKQSSRVGNSNLYIGGNNTTGYYGTGNYNEDYLSSGSMSSSSFTTTVISKPERITFVAPHSTIEKIVPIYANRYIDAKKVPVKSYDSVFVSESIDGFGKKVLHRKSYKVSEFDKNQTLLNIRNFISISSSEDFKNEKYIDNVFWAEKVIMVDNSHSDEDIIRYPFKPRSNSFYFFTR